METSIELQTAAFKAMFAQLNAQTADLRRISAQLNAQTSSINEMRAVVGGSTAAIRDIVMVGTDINETSAQLNAQTSSINEMRATIKETTATIEQITAKVETIGTGLNAVRRELSTADRRVQMTNPQPLHQPVLIVQLPSREEPKPVEPFLYQYGIRGLTPRGAPEPVRGKLSMDRLVRDRNGKLMPG